VRRRRLQARVCVEAVDAGPDARDAALDAHSDAADAAADAPDTD
jgi:hypothetical protein